MIVAHDTSSPAGRHSRDARYERVSAVVGTVLCEALRATGTRAIVLLDAESPEGELVTRICSDAHIPLVDYSDPASCLTAHPANKTTLLTGAFFPRVDVFPLGDLYATQVEFLTGGWSADDAVHALARAAGGIAELDAVLQQCIDGRELFDHAAAGLPAEARVSLRAALERTRFRRASAGLVPKLGSRTIGVDLLD